MKRLVPVLLAVLVVAYGAVSVRPAWQRVVSVEHGRDYATFHYAVIEAVSPGRPGRGNPYDTEALSTWALQEGTRPTVHPWFYPPPALLPLLWVVPPGGEPLSLAVGYRAWFWLQQACVLGVFAVLWRWLRLHPLLLGLLAVSFSPIGDNAKMGQANLPVLLLVVLGLWRSSGTLVGAAAMAKMSPALYLFAWAAQRRWRPVLVACGTAVALSLLALPLVPLDTQLHFYREVLPGFASGHYNGLRVPITLPANHSIPDLFNQLWPGPDAHTLSDRARVGAQLTSLCLLAGLSWVARVRRDTLGDACLFGAFTALMLVTPVYTYEHHLVMMLLPIAAAAKAVTSGRLGRPWAAVLVLAYGLVAWPLYMLRGAQQALPALSWWLQESKLLGVALIAAACLVAARRSPRG